MWLWNIFNLIILSNFLLFNLNISTDFGFIDLI